jgi:Ca2+-binding EF-hand superfamily protein
MTRKAIALILMSFVVGTASTAALAAPGDRETRILMQMIDTDHDGIVSKEEFMQFMSKQFDRLDVKKKGTIEAKDLRAIRNPNWSLGDCARGAFPACSGGQ